MGNTNKKWKFIWRKKPSNAYRSACFLFTFFIDVARDFDLVLRNIAPLPPLEVVVTEYIKQKSTDMQYINCTTTMKTLVLFLVGSIVAHAKGKVDPHIICWFLDLCSSDSNSGT